MCETYFFHFVKRFSNPVCEQEMTAKQKQDLAKDGNLICAPSSPDTGVKTVTVRSRTGFSCRRIQFGQDMVA